MKIQALVVLMFLSISGNALAVLSGGGTQANPYLIQSRADFDEFANPANAATHWASGVYTKLICDPNLAGTTYTQAVIGSYNGVFDGNGHTISNLTITASTQDYVGLFGEVGSGGQIMDLGVEDVNVAGSRYVGGLAGINYETITDCYSTGSVSGENSVGGLVGYNDYGGTLADCYSTGSVSGGYSVGGLVGLVGLNNNGTITSCYSTGSVSGTDFVGGLVGYRDGGTLTSCFWDTNTSGTSDGVGSIDPDPNGVTGESTEDMKKLSTFTDAGWDFTNEATNGTNDTWRMCTDGASYPQLNWQSPDADLACPNGVNIEDLGVLLQRWLSDSCDLSNNFCGGADIDNSGTVDMMDYAMMAQHWLEGM